VVAGGDGGPGELPVTLPKWTNAVAVGTSCLRVLPHSLLPVGDGWETAVPAAWGWLHPHHPPPPLLERFGLGGHLSSLLFPGGFCLAGAALSAGEGPQRGDGGKEPAERGGLGGGSHPREDGAALWEGTPSFEARLPVSLPAKGFSGSGSCADKVFIKVAEERWESWCYV